MGNIIRLFLPKQEPVLVGDNDSYISEYSAEVGLESDNPQSSSKPNNNDGMFIPKKRKRSKSPKRKRRSKK